MTIDVKVNKTGDGRDKNLKGCQDDVQAYQKKSEDREQSRLSRYALSFPTAPQIMP